jgi:ATP-dependent protease HslVU (ClpYQ) peptidase subunit
MSVVAVKVTPDHIEIAADSIGVQGTTQEKDPGNKLFKIKPNLVLGSCGTSAMGLLMFEHLTFFAPAENTLWGWLGCVKDFIQKCKKLDTNLDPDSNAFFVVCDDKVWYSYGLHVKEITTYHAIGAGMDFALAALYLGHGATKAVEVSCELCTQCEMPINTIFVPKRG